MSDTRLTATELHLVRLIAKRNAAYLRWSMLRASREDVVRKAWGFLVGWDRAYHAIQIGTRATFETWTQL